jgi:azurin
MKTKSLPASLTVSLVAVTLLAVALMTSASVSGKNVVIVAGDSMKFSVTRIEAQPGQKIHVQLNNEGTLPKEVMAHNWILLKAGQNVTAYATAALSAKDQGYLPPSLADEVLASIPLVGGGRTGDVTFTAPTEPGSYPFLCSFPAHCQVGMRGELLVK